MKKCAIVIGHKSNSPGALNKTRGLSEFSFNDELARRIEALVKDIEIQRIYRRTYDTLPTDINHYNPDFIISLHCNAYNEEATGTEVLYYHKSIKGKKIAAILQKNLVDSLGLKNRGIKPKTAEDRGGYLLTYTNAPCLISEPFFLDNNSDLEIIMEKYEKLITAYVNSISEISKNI